MILPMESIYSEKEEGLIEKDNYCIISLLYTI